MNKSNESRSAESIGSIDVFFEKAEGHRTVVSDGAWVALTPTGELQVVFFKNLTPAPEYIRQEVSATGGLGGEIETTTRTGIVREYGVTVVMSDVTAKEVVKILSSVLSSKEVLDGKLREARGES